MLPEWEVRIGESGRIAIRGGGLFAGQLVEEGSGWSFRARQGDWFETSDRGELDSGGLVVHGRIDSVVKVLGELVDPVAIEARLGLDGIAVVALPDGRKEHRLLVVFDRSVERWVVERAVSGHNAGCPGFERLDGPVEIPELPRSPLGKLRRQELTEWLRPQ